MKFIPLVAVILALSVVALASVVAAQDSEVRARQRRTSKTSTNPPPRGYLCAAWFIRVTHGGHFSRSTLTHAPMHLIL